MKEKEEIYIKNKHLFKNKIQMIIYIIIFIILIYLFIYLGAINYNEELADNEQMASMFSRVTEDNVFEIATAEDARSIAMGKKGIVLFGVENEWVNYYASLVNRIAKEQGIDKIYYYDITKNRQDNNGTYEDIVLKLNDYVTYNDRGKTDIYAPTLLVVSNDTILLFDTETSFVTGNITPSEYWTYEKEITKENEFREVFQKYIGSE